MHKRNKILIGLLSTVVLVGTVKHFGWVDCLGMPASFAQDPLGRTQGTENLCVSTYNLIAQGIGLMHYVAFLLFGIIEPLLNPDFVLRLNNLTSASGAPIGLTLNKIWQIMRNVTNLALAFGLVVGVVYTIVTANGGLSQMLPRFILSIILVNFSWFFPQVILEAATVMSASIYNLPNTIGTNCQIYKNGSPTGPCQYVNQIILQPFEAAQCAGMSNVYDTLCYNTAPITPATNSPYVILNGLIYNMARLKDLPLISATPSGFVNAPPGPSTVGPVTECFYYLTRIFMNAVLMMMSFFPLIALTLALLVRIPIIWLTTAFMPLVFIGVAARRMIPAEIDPVDKIFKTFISAAFMPVYVAVPIAVGFIMLSALGSTSGAGFGGMLAGAQGQIVAGIASFWDVLWMAMAGIIMWVGVFTALATQKITAGLTNSIKHFGQGVMKAGLSIPFVVPILPGPTGLQSVRDAAAKPMEAVENLKLRGGSRGLGIGASTGDRQKGGTSGGTATNNITINIQDATKIHAEIANLGMGHADDQLVKLRQELIQKHRPTNPDTARFTDDQVKDVLENKLPAGSTFTQQQLIDIAARINTTDKIKQRASTP